MLHTKAYTQEESEEMRSYAREHAPILPRWMEYPAPMRDEWRKLFGFPWREVMGKPLAIDCLPNLDQDPGEVQLAKRGPPERDSRPPDVPPQPLLPSGGAEVVTVRQLHRRMLKRIESGERLAPGGFLSAVREQT